MNDAATAWTVILAAIALTYLWRGLGVAFAARIDPQGRVFRWVTCVSYAMLAALISRMLLLPIGVLEETSLAWRLTALAVALVVFFGAGRRLLLSVASGVLVFMALTAWG